ncbi:GNAT family N-acetyltransferase [Marinobacter nanhaiticus D15-8W]|uniref:GNAT family N-acetyltransferase n=1 Tax=Marinobacter nanhaiticus D15-8W TaxID=626887 RepID=N6WV42_9GAMM|nr:GNAT family N-acetyltransferase [Marinobacter nanhaiticus]ENO12688.1 GNAT family N-acetyltransferase [Marinobacter nanhaiticus D15-8W]BES70028.1 GNAT family N-acetyltransferase [Marinobacter nanhaiticus D15-8W]
MELTLDSIVPQHAEFLSQIELDKTQQEYIGGLDNYCNVQSGELILMVKLDDTPIGAMKLDFEYSSTYCFATTNEIGLRGVMIDRKFQGRGYGLEAILQLRQFVSKYYKNYTAICLTVNHNNTQAYRCYLKAGFVDINKDYNGGALGPQRIMRLEI